MGFTEYWRWVLVKVVVYDGKHKIADRWEDHLYVVISQPITDIPVFKASREDVQEMLHNLDPEYHPEVSSVDGTESENHSVEEKETESVRDPSIEETETDSVEESTPPKATQN